MSEPYHILVVDDDPITIALAAEALASERHCISCASDGRAALALLNETEFDLVLIDIAMPEMDGFALLRTLRNHPRLYEIPVIVITGLDDCSAEPLAYANGAQLFLAKPLDWQQLPLHVRRLIRDADDSQTSSPDTSPLCPRSNMSNYI